MQITKDMDISDVLSKYPSLVRTFIDFGLPCLVCGEPFWGTIEELAQKNKVDVQKLVNKLNEYLGKTNEKL